MNEFDNIITLNDEKGNEVLFEFLDLVEYKENEYVVLLPTEETEDEQEASGVVILQIEDSDEDDQNTYISVEDEATLFAVYEIFKDKFKDVFDFRESV